MTKIGIFGASGPTGHHVVSSALEDGHDVTALVRDPIRLPISHRALKVVVGNSQDASAVRNVVNGQDVVISALGAGKTFRPRAVIERSLRVMVPAMEAAGVRRFIHLSAFGVAGTLRDTPLLSRLFAATLLRAIYADKRKGEAILRNSNLEWIIVCPTALTNKPPRGEYRVGERLELRGLPSISRADVARFMLTQLDDPRYVGREVLVSW